MMTERMADDRWTLLGPIYPGGTVMALAAFQEQDRDIFLAATQTGIFRSEDGGRTWLPANEGLPTLQISALAFSPDGTAFAGGLSGGIAISVDRGQSWYVTPSSGLEEAVVTLAPSPRYATDGTLLVGTDGSGVMRSADRGRTWSAANFHLPDLSVLALAVAPVWNRRETVFAATADGVYRSTNGARAWRDAGLGLEGQVVQALAVSPNFDQDQIVFAGTESRGIYRSTDGGRTWSHCGGGEGVTVNCLWISPKFAKDGLVLAGTSSGIMRSTDRGETWELTYEGDELVLALAGTERAICAGVIESGILRSTDGGTTWQVSNEGLTARTFLRVFLAGETIYAFGPQDGIVRSDDGGRSWRSLPGLAEHLPVNAVGVSERPSGQPAVLIAAADSGEILRSTDGGETWTEVAVGIHVSTIAFDPEGEHAWIGTQDGHLFVSRNGGASWEGLPRAPFTGETIMALQPSYFFAEDRTLLVGSMAQPSSTARLWRSVDDGQSWQLIHETQVDVPWIALVAPAVRGRQPYDRMVMSAGRVCIVPTGQRRDDWMTVSISEEQPSVLALVVDPRKRTIYAGTNLGLYRSQDTGRTWTPVSGPLEERPILDLQVNDEGQYLLVLAPGGTLWRYRLPL
ncbi:MAG: hypothetical protein Kow0047_30830 [Anaerolineae bacterium]